MSETKRILIVDDEEAVNTVLGELLGEEGYDLSFATTCGDAMDLLDNERFDLVITDKNLPDDSGMEVIRKARETDEGPEAIMITAYASLETAIEAMDLGARGYILKPFDDIGEVLEKVQKILAAAEERARMKNLISELRKSNELMVGGKK